MADVTMQYLINIKRRLGSGRSRLAEIKTASTSRTERAQLLLITALALAVILVTVALLLNAAIFTENVATRDTTADGPEAIELRGEVVQGISELIETENHEGSGSLTAVEEDIDAMAPMVDRERAREGTVGTLSHDPNDIESGTLLRYNETDGDARALSEAGSNNWTLVDDLGSARAFTVGIEPSTLNGTTAASSDDSFGIRFNSSSEDDVTLHIYDDDDADDQLAITRVEDGDIEQRCRIDYDDSPVEIDITGDRLSTDESVVDCYRGLWPDNDPDTIEFINIDEEEGATSVIVDEGTGWTAEVTDTDAVYSATVDISYQTTDLSFETTARIAPGEP